MENQCCPLMDTCPIFINNVLIKPASALSYKIVYCNAGEVKWSECKRFIIKNILGKQVPEHIMPNSLKTIQQLLEELSNETVI